MLIVGLIVGLEFVLRDSEGARVLAKDLRLNKGELVELDNRLFIVVGEARPLLPNEALGVGPCFLSSSFVGAASSGQTRWIITFFVAH